MPVYNEADIVGHVIQHTINQGLELVILDGGSTDGSQHICQKFLGKGVLEIQCAETDSLDLIFNLRRLEEMAQNYHPNWLAVIDSDEIHESPFRNVTLAKAIEHEASSGYNLIQSNNFDFWPTPADDGKETDPLRRIRHYVYADDFRFRFWENNHGVDCWSSGGHYPSFPVTVKPKISPHKFVIRHYRIRSTTQGRKKAIEQRIQRFKHPPLPAGWAIHYDKVIDDNSNFAITPDKLTKYDESGNWKFDQKFDSYMGSWTPPSTEEAKRIATSGFPVSPRVSRTLCGIGTRVPPDEGILKKILLEVYANHPDLRSKYPEVNPNNIQNLVEWMVAHGLKELHPAFTVLAPILTLRSLYNNRADLQATYPEVKLGDYKRLIEWAVQYGLTSDSSTHMLKPYSHWYKSYQHNLTGNRASKWGSWNVITKLKRLPKTL